jgi:glycosyltransferase involved in cell wall biosynthesis
MKQQYPLVSIAIITYNQKEFLGECINSCLNQDYTNIEIVIADDGSTDGTHEMLEEYSISYPGKFVLKLSQSNQGITINSNAANFACSGKYIAWMGGDDLMLPGKLSKQVSFMEANLDCAICYHDLDVFENSTNKTLYVFSDKSKPMEGGASASVKYGAFNGACSTMVRRSCTPEKGFEESIPLASDWLYWVETLINGGDIKFIPEILGRYRRHNNNATKNNGTAIGQNTIDHLNSCNFIITHYPQYFKEAIFRYSMNIRSIRKKIPYTSSLLYVFKASLDIKSLFCIFIYILTFKKIKL